MNTLFRHTVPAAALLAAIALALFAPILLAAPDSAARRAGADLRPWLERDLGPELLLDAETRLRPALTLDPEVGSAAVEVAARGLPRTLEPWLHRDLRDAIQREIEDRYQRKYGRIAMLDPAESDGLVCL